MSDLQALIALAAKADASLAEVRVTIAAINDDPTLPNVVWGSALAHRADALAAISDAADAITMLVGLDTRGMTTLVKAARSTLTRRLLDLES